MTEQLDTVTSLLAELEVALDLRAGTLREMGDPSGIAAHAADLIDEVTALVRARQGSPAPLER